MENSIDVLLYIKCASCDNIESEEMSMAQKKRSTLTILQILQEMTDEEHVMTAKKIIS